MTNKELLEGLSQDLAELNATKKTHIQIERILQAYKQEVAKGENDAEVVEEDNG